MIDNRVERAVDRLRLVFERGSRGSRAPHLTLPESVKKDIIDHMCRSLPFEGVGLVATRALAPRMIAHRFYAGRNVDASPKRYTMDPVDVFAALHDMERRGMRLLAIVHSHPETPPVPSVSDLAEAKIPGVLSLIVGLNPEVDLRAWNFAFGNDGTALQPEEVRIVNCPGAQGERTRVQFSKS